MEGLSLREIYGVEFQDHFIPSEEYIAKREQEMKPYGGDIWETIHRGSFPELYLVRKMNKRSIFVFPIMRLPFTM